MKLLDEKLVEKAAKAYALIKNNEHEITFMLSKSDFKAGVSFAEQQLKEKMIEFAKWITLNGWKRYVGTDCIRFFNDSDFELGSKTTEQLLEQFLNKG